MLLLVDSRKILVTHAHQPVAIVEKTSSCPLIVVEASWHRPNFSHRASEYACLCLYACSSMCMITEPLDASPAEMCSLHLSSSRGLFLRHSVVRVCRSDDGAQDQGNC
jgi:hypothetical protein